MPTAAIPVATRHLARANHPRWRCFVENEPRRSKTRSFSMNKTDLINAIAEKAELTKADATRALEAFFETVQKTLKSGEDVSVVGFGTFTVRARAARTGRNPRTNEMIQIQASKVPAFKAGKTLKDALN
jgi:DNA-binding protein HU-beta